MLHDLNKLLGLPEISAEQALAVIASENALAKTLVHERDKPSNLLNQLADPANIRPVRDTLETQCRDRSFIFNPKTGHAYYRHLNKIRGATKAPDYLYTKKTATTLLPANGRITLYRSHDQRDHQRVGLVFNLQECHLKDGKYIFERNANTHSKFWLGQQYNTEALPRAVTLSQLTALNREAVRQYGMVSHNNEILVGLSKKSVIAVFAPENTIHHRLNTLVMQDQVRKTLGIVVPVLIIDSIRGVTAYSKEQQVADLQCIAQQNPAYLRQQVSPDLADYIEKTLNIRRANYSIDQIIIDLQHSFEDGTLQTTVDMLDFVQLSNVMYKLEHAQEKSSAQVLMATLSPKYEKRKVQDLAELRSLLTREFYITTEEINSQNYYKFNESIKSRVILHLSYLHPIKLANLIGYVYDSFDSIVLQIKYANSAYFKPYHRVVLSPPEGSSVYYVTDNAISAFSPLLEIIISRDKTQIALLIPLILKHHTQHIENILQNLMKLAAFSKKYGKDCSYSSNNIENVIQALALHLESLRHHVSESTLAEFNHLLAESLTHDKRRALETALLSQISRLTTKEEVHAFYRDHGDTATLTHQRHAAHGLFTTIKLNVLTALQQRLTQVNNTEHRSTFIEQETITLKRELVLLLEERKVQLKASFVSFFSPGSTQQKIAKMDGIIERLKPIQSLDELRFFAATLMADDTLVGRRTPGFSLSDTAIKLRDFYQRAFITKTPTLTM